MTPQAASALCRFRSLNRRAASVLCRFRSLSRQAASAPYRFRLMNQRVLPLFPPWTNRQPVLP
jgi:hypothetical protein